MHKEIITEQAPIKLWLNDIEEGALNQAKNLANLPFTFKHVAIMPDAHEGYGMPIGGVLATREVIIPNAVGVDIGCGMCAVRTNLRVTNKKQLNVIMQLTRSMIPLGAKHHKKAQKDNLMPVRTELPPIAQREYTSARHQLGTLGGGNHFIEVQKGSDGFIWLMIHSGSRNIGKKVADHYNRMAVALNEKWKSPVPRNWQLAYLPLDDEAAHTYIEEMQYCVDFAFANRKLMMQRFKEAFSEVFHGRIQFGEMINIAHNYAAKEEHFQKKVWVHRKGATSALAGQTGIIPGSQGTQSYIVTGLGNPESFMSCSHGAGRVMGRRQAQRELDLMTEIGKLENKGIIHAVHTQRDLDEASGAYKDINLVMRNQQDLVTIMVELEPLAVIKG